MWQERFEEMQEKVDKFLIVYKQDFEVDKKAILDEPDGIFLWMLRKTGTQLVNLTKVKNGECKITDTALFYFYEIGVPCQLYLVSADRLKRLRKQFVDDYLKKELYGGMKNESKN